MGPIRNTLHQLLLHAGGTSPGGLTASTHESWNGTNWTEVADLNTARNQLAAAWCR